MAKILPNAGRPGAVPQGKGDQLGSAQTQRPFQRGGPCLAERISHHLRDNAVDIQWQANEPYRKALADIARERGYILKNEGYPQHHHLTFTNRQ